jgi:hypothetical protein
MMARAVVLLGAVGVLVLVSQVVSWHVRLS